jgi:uncharacterized protein YndB with AHSA1/START domain
MINSDAVEVSIDIAVDPATAFKVFTRDIDLWWLKDKQYRFNWRKQGKIQLEPQLGGKVQELYDDGSSFYLGKILQWAPPYRLVFEWRSPNYQPDQLTTVEVTFENIDTGTRAKVVHRGWNSLPDNHPARHGLEGWDFIFLWGGLWRQHCRLLKLICERYSSERYGEQNNES